MENATPGIKLMTRTIRIVHGALAFMIVAFGAASLWINNTDPVGELTDENRVLLYVPAVLLIIAIPVSAMVFNARLKFHPDMPLENKMQAFRSAHIIRMALLEAPAVVAVAVSLLTADNHNLITLAIVLLVFVFLLPSPNGIALALNLDPYEKEKL